MTTITLVIDGLAAGFVAVVMAKISVEDSATRKIRNKKVALIALAGLVYRIVAQIERFIYRDDDGLIQTLEPLWQGIGGMLIVALPMFLAAYYMHVPIGGGDIKLMGALGIYVGIGGSLWILLLSCLAVCIVYGVRMAATRKAINLKTSVPMGLYIHIGYTIFICSRLVSPWL